MIEHLRRNTVAYLALFIALGARPYAVTHAYGTAQLRNGAVTGAKLAKGAVTGTKVEDGSLTAADFKPGSLPMGRHAAPGTEGRSGGNRHGRSYRRYRPSGHERVGGVR
jgi:hypothetical protein